MLMTVEAAEQVERLTKGGLRLAIVAKLILRDAQHAEGLGRGVAVTTRTSLSKPEALLRHDSHLLV